jgi:hypothetical protein
MSMNPFKLLAVIMSFSALLLAAGCGEDPQRTGIPKDLDLSHLLQSWTRSYEEEPRTPTGSVHMFRPIEFKQFPPSWFRMRYIFSEDGVCEWLFLDPADAHFTKLGRWETDPQDEKVILIYDANGTLVESVSFRIIEIDEDLLRVEVGLGKRKDG